MSCIWRSLPASESPDKSVIGRVISQANTGKVIQVGSLTPIRDFIYIEDVVKGYLHLLEHPANGFRTVNLSTGVGTSVADLVRIVSGLTGRQQKATGGIIEWPVKAKDVSVLSNELLAKVTGWRPQWALKEGLVECLQKVMSK